LYFVVGDPDVTSFHGAVVVGVLAGFGLNMKQCTIFREEKAIGHYIEEISGHGKKGKWT
jgi:hypothetical protein